MDKKRREEFILNLRVAARTLVRPNVEVVGAATADDRVGEIVHRGDQWLTTRYLTSYNPEDFEDLGEDRQGRLDRSIEEFRAIASNVAGQPATHEQYRIGKKAFLRVIDEVGSIVREEWLQALDAFEAEIEQWAAESGWPTKREPKAMRETLLGEYSAPRLLFTAPAIPFVVDPLARFVPGGAGSIELAVRPSYDAITLYRDRNRSWRAILPPNPRRGHADPRRVPWNRRVFDDCIDRLREFA